MSLGEIMLREAIEHIIIILLHNNDLVLLEQTEKEIQEFVCFDITEIHNKVLSNIENLQVPKEAQITQEIISNFIQKIRR